MMTTHQNGFRFFKFTPIFCRITPITMGKLRVLTIMLLLADYCLQWDLSAEKQNKLGVSTILEKLHLKIFSKTFQYLRKLRGFLNRSVSLLIGDRLSTFVCITQLIYQKMKNTQNAKIAHLRGNFNAVIKCGKGLSQLLDFLQCDLHISNLSFIYIVGCLYYFHRFL